MKCYKCGRKPIFPGEGRIADGSWAADKDLPPDAKGKWFCSFDCYDKILREEEKRKFRREE